MSKKPCKWESTCDDDCRRPYGNCPKDCKNYKPYVSVEEIENEIDGGCPNCLAFGLHCPHKVEGDPYHYDCKMTVYTLEMENGKLEGKIADLESEYYELENIKDNETTELKAQIEQLSVCGMTEDKRCLNCSRMTVSQDEYISAMEDEIHDLEKENEHLKTIWDSYTEKEEDWDKERHVWMQERFDFRKKITELEIDNEILISRLKSVNNCNFCSCKDCSVESCPNCNVV